MKRRIFVILKWALLLYLLYLAAGALLPFVHTKKTGEEFKNNFEPASFYSETESVDRARVVETSMDALESRVLMIHQAEKRIVLSTFDIRDGSSCRDIFSSAGGRGPWRKGSDSRGRIVRNPSYAGKPDLLRGRDQSEH